MAAEATASGREGGGIVKLMDVNDFDDADKWTDISEDDERGFDPAEGYRDDSGKTFAHMLREEDLDPATIRRLMDQYEAEDNWNYKRSQRQDRLINLHTGQRILAKHKDGMSKEAPKPRTFEVCKWKGTDPDGNVFACNNNRIRHPRSGELLEVCGFHQRLCLGNHAGEPPRIEAPNKHGLSSDIYKRKFMAEPPRYKSALHIPGVVFFSAASRRHPLAPKEADYSSSEADSDSDASEEIQKGPKGGLIKRLWHKIKRSTISRDDQHNAAKIIQGLYRLRAAKRVVYRLRREEQVRARLRATVFIQRMVRAKLEMQRLRQRKAISEQAACIVQKNYRFHKYRREVSSDRARAAAALIVQNWWRRHLARENFKILRMRLSAKLASLEKARSLIDLDRFLLGFAGRVRARRLRKQRQQENYAACIIQDFFLRFFGNGRSVRTNKLTKVVQEAQRHDLVSRIQKAFRSSAQYRAGKASRKHMIARLIQIQCIARRFLARLERWARKRRRESVWAWLNPKVPRGWYEKHLALPNYESMFRDRLAEIRGGPPPMQESKYDIGERKAVNEGEDADKALAWLSKLEKAFQHIDKKGSGTVTKLEFWRVLDQSGIRLKPEFKEYIAEAFVNPLTDSVSWLAYIRFGKSIPSLCPLHRVPICPECLYIGPCPLSGCKEFRPNQNERFTESSMCSCGFHVSRHRPALRAHTDLLAGEKLSAGSAPADSRSQVARYAFQDPPEMPRPVTPPDLSGSHKVSIQNTEAFTRVHGLDVKVVAVPDAALQVREGQTLKVMKAQRRALTAYLHMATSAAQKPIREERSRQEKENQRHKYFHEESLKKGRLLTTGDGQHLSQHSSTVLARIANPEDDQSDNFFSTIGPDGRAVQVKQKASDKHLIFESGAEGVGLNTQEYVKAAKMGIHIPLPSAIKTEHFMDKSECAAVADDENTGTESKLASWSHEVQTAKRAELGLMKVEAGDLVPGLVGAGKSSTRMAYEAGDKVGPGGKRGFRISRPIMFINNNQLELTPNATLLYLSLLRTFAAPNLDGYDILADQQRCVKYCFDHHSFLDQHWDKIVKDVRMGTVSMHLKLEPHVRLSVQEDMLPNPERSLILEKLFDKLGYRRRAIARGSLSLPTNYLKIGKDKAEDPAVLKRKLKITNRERFRHGPSSQLAQLPRVPLFSAGPVSHVQELKATATSNIKGAYRSKVAEAIDLQGKLAAIVEAAQTAKQVKALGIPTVVAEDADGKEFEFGYVEGAARPYLDLHPGSGAAFTTIKTALEHAKKHAGTHLRTQSAADHYLKATWESAGIAEWPGEEVLPEEREFPQETEVRELLKQHLRREKLDESSLAHILPQECEVSTLVSTKRTAANTAQSGYMQSAGQSVRAATSSQLIDQQVQRAVERKTPAQISENSPAPFESPNTNPNMSFGTNWHQRATPATNSSLPASAIQRSPQLPHTFPLGAQNQDEIQAGFILHQLPPAAAEWNETLSQLIQSALDTSNSHGTQISIVGGCYKSPPFVCEEPFKLPSCPHHQWLAPAPLCESCKSYRRLPLPQPPCTFVQCVHFYRQGVLDVGSTTVFDALKRLTSAPRSSCIRQSRLSTAGQTILGTRHPGSDLNGSHIKLCGLQEGVVARHDSSGKLTADETLSIVMVQSASGSYPLLVKYICCDRHHHLWLMGFRLWRKQDLGPTHKLRPGFHHTLETVRGSKAVYLKVTSGNIGSIGLAMRTNHVKHFKAAVRRFRMDQLLAERGVHPALAGQPVSEKMRQQVDLTAAPAVSSCFFFCDTMRPEQEDECWVAEMQSKK